MATAFARFSFNALLGDPRGGLSLLGGVMPQPGVSQVTVRRTALRAVWERYRTLGEALQFGMKAQILWNTRNLLVLVREYSK